MTTLQKYSVSSIYTPSAVYSDPFFSYKQRSISYDEGFKFTEIDALSGVYDSSINNYTSHYLTGKKNISDIFKILTKDNTINTLTTSLIFDSLNASRDLQVNKYLYTFKQSNSAYRNDIKPAGIQTIPINIFDNSAIFELEFINGKYVRIKHNNGLADYYLNYISNNVCFYNYQSDPRTITDERNDMFTYELDDVGYLTLYKNVSSNDTRVLIYDNDTLSFDTVKEGKVISRVNSLIKIDYTYKNIQYKSGTSWITYDTTRINDLIANEERSVYDLKSQYLLHTNYNTSLSSIDLNYITLNNQRSEKNYIKSGTNMLIGNVNHPDVNFREYTSIFTGNDQEGGNSKIALSYVFYNKDIIINNGSDTFFKAPSSIYPYEKLNINDTDFAQNGSLAGTSPLVSDKIYINQKYSTQNNNGRYMCTWLSADNPGSYGMWVDRYYDENANTETPIIDYKSSLAIEPNVSYKYERLGEADINNYINSSNPIVSGFPYIYDINNIQSAYAGTEVIYDGTNYSKYLVAADVNKTKQFTISFDIYIQPDKDYGFQLLGNKTNAGFGVRNNQIITPFIYTYSGNTLYVYNSDYTLITTAVFNSDIKDIIIYEPLQDFFVVCTGGQIYKLNAQANKIKLETIPNLNNYINYLQEQDRITFLTSSSGSCIEVNLKTLQPTNVANAVSFEQYSNGNYDYAKSLIRYNNALLYLPGERVKYEGYGSNYIFYTVRDVNLVKHNLLNNEAEVFLRSQSRITDFNIDSNKNIYIGHNNKISVYTTLRQFVSSYALSAYSPVLSAGGKILNIDFGKEYTPTSTNTYVTNLVADPNNNLNVIKYNTSGNASVVFAQLSGTGKYSEYNSLTAKRYTQTNYNYFNNIYKPKNISFELTLTNYLSSEDILDTSINFDTSNIDTGYHTLTYRFDSLQGNITLFVNGLSYTTINVSPGKYKIQNIFNDDLFIGTAGFFNGIDLATYLRQPGYYFTKDFRIKNLFIYNRPVSNDTVAALTLLGKKIDQLVLSMPAGQRNNLEQVERFFKFSQTNSSKLIDIYIKNLNITNIDFRNNIINNILAQATSLLPIGVAINNINFVDYK